MNVILAVYIHETIILISYILSSIRNGFSTLMRIYISIFYLLLRGYNSKMFSHHKTQWSDTRKDGTLTAMQKNATICKEYKIILYFFAENCMTLCVPYLCPILWFHDSQVTILELFCIKVLHALKGYREDNRSLNYFLINVLVHINFSLCS